MDDTENVNDASRLRPIHTNTFALPNDKGVKLAYAVYNPADESLLLENERKRTVFPEVFITNPNLGTLSDLCIRVLTSSGLAASIPFLENDPLKQRLLNDTISVDEPLEKIFEINDKLFWKRVALAKSPDVNLQLQNDKYDWKSEGVTLKFVELIENHPAEYLVEEEMCILADRIKDYVRDMHIRKLQPLTDASFEQLCSRDSDTDKTTTTDVSNSTTEEEEEETERQQTEEGSNESPDGDENVEVDSGSSKVENDAKGMFVSHTSLAVGKSKADRLPANRKTSARWSIYRVKASEHNEEFAFENARLKAKTEKETQIRKEDRRKRREEQEHRRLKREEKRALREEILNRPKPKKIRVRNVYGLPDEEVPDDEHKKLDKRNLESFLKLKKKESFIYQPDHCHHIDLSFLSYFENLVSFHIEFQPPAVQSNFHRRFFEFSHNDILGLARGIMDLHNLRIFRLRNSRMDAHKLSTIVFALGNLDLEIVDFGNDTLQDDCEVALRDLLKSCTTLRSLELECNNLGFITMSSLGRSLQYFYGHLEYLGLARNPIGSEGLHALTSKISRTNQVEELCLAGIRITDVAILCCIGEELLNRHKVLRKLSLMGSPLSSKSGELLVDCMRRNTSVLEFDCRGCNLTESIELDVEVCLCRNRYMNQNAFIGNKDMTEEEINDYVKAIKNPLLLAINEKIEKKKLCMENRPPCEIPEDEEEQQSGSETPAGSFVERPSVYYRPSQPFVLPFNDSAASLSQSEEETAEILEPFVYDVMQFDEKELLEHVDLPGPSNRYYYFRPKPIQYD